MSIFSELFGLLIPLGCPSLWWSPKLFRGTWFNQLKVRSYRRQGRINCSKNDRKHKKCSNNFRNLFEKQKQDAILHLITFSRKILLKLIPFLNYWVVKFVFLIWDHCVLTHPIWTLNKIGIKIKLFRFNKNANQNVCWTSQCHVVFKKAFFISTKKILSCLNFLKIM